MARVLRPRVAAAVSGLLICPAVIVATAGPAAASCLGPPPPSPHAFTGTVLTTRLDGRMATVRIASGATVIVRGAAEGKRAFTTVDRHYKAGRSYEFHPVNARSPFRDSACTRTHKIRGGNLAGDKPEPEEPAEEVAPEVRAATPMTPADDDDGSLVSAATAKAIAACAAVLTLLVFLLRRRRLIH